MRVDGKKRVCFGCVPPKRTPTCHSTCPEYLKEFERAEKDRIKRDKEREAMSILSDVRMKRQDRYTKSMHKNIKLGGKR